MSQTSRIPGFYKHSVQRRLRLLFEQGVLSREDYDALRHTATTIVETPGQQRI